jgi:hypothetical protein
MPTLHKETNGSRPERQDLLHVTARFGDTSRVASTKDRCPPHAAALQETSDTATKDPLRNGKGSLVTAPVSALIYPSILIDEQVRKTSAPIYERARTKASRSGRPRKEKHDPFKHHLLAQFGFQPFKKCFYGKCSTIFVPGDFKPSSPRRMFCSTMCFEAHWRQKLFRYLEKALAQDVDDTSSTPTTPPAMNSYVSM